MNKLKINNHKHLKILNRLLNKLLNQYFNLKIIIRKSCKINHTTMLMIIFIQM